MFKEPLLSSQVALKIARHIKGNNSDYYSSKEGLAELESIISRHFAAACQTATTTPPDFTEPETRNEPSWLDNTVQAGGLSCGNCKQWRILQGREIERCRGCGDDAIDAYDLAAQWEAADIGG